MAWSAATESEIRDSINAAEERMSAEQLRLWECISVIPNKWVQHPYGDLGGGFWVVAIVGRFVVWFNDIEDGFDVSEYSVYGEISGYGASQYALEVAVQHLVNMIANGIGRRI
ncbi:hypothetical protein [Niveispirillum sp. KHB5.9]|uniref:hypothetical protein n=1 Tax=Niveispirillum sp. KHB5.9 TaxID=3400269 RepID=UPI003A8B0579